MKSFYSENSVKRRLRFKEISREKISISDFNLELTSNLNALKEGNLEFEFDKRKSFYVVNSFVQKLILRQANYRLKKTYKDLQSNRRTIINQIVSLMNQGGEFFVVRTDISAFYESIDKNILINKLKEDRILTYESLDIIIKALCNPIINDGLPRGLSISSTLSEIYMRQFDKKVKSTEGVFYYARFVDDIVVFTTSKESQQSILQKMPAWLPNGLVLNKKKTKLTSSSKLNQSDSFEYLGYSFEISNKSSRESTPRVSIAKKKLRKIKSRLCYSFADYAKTGDYDLLKRRIDFLSCNYVLRGGSKSKLMAGISYNYSKITQLEDLDELNNFYHNLLNCSRHNLGVKLSSKLSISQVNDLGKCSFKYRFKNRVVKKFSTEEILNIKRCWSHES